MKFIHYLLGTLLILFTFTSGWCYDIGLIGCSVSCIFLSMFTIVAFGVVAEMTS